MRGRISFDLHLCATLPNFLIWEHRTGDVQCRYEIMAPQPICVDSYITIPEGPGLGIDIVDDAIESYASELLGGHSSYSKDERYDSQYVYARHPRGRWLKPE